MLICKLIPEGAGLFAFESFLCDVMVLQYTTSLSELYQDILTISAKKERHSS